MSRKINTRFLSWLACIVVAIGIGTGAFFSRHIWLPLLNRTGDVDSTAQEVSPPVEEAKVLKLSEQARDNLKLTAKPVSIQTYWRKIQIPGVIADLPGFTDRGITSPLGGVVAQIHAYEGDIIQPGEKLFTLRLISELMQKTQSDLFKAIRETELLNLEISRISQLAKSGAIPEKQLIELNQQISRQQALIEAFHQEFLTRGLTRAQIRQIESGEFLTTIDVFAPEVSAVSTDTTKTLPVGFGPLASPDKANFLEMQKLNVELGQQIEAGELLAVLANHNSLYIKGNAFKKEASNLAHAAEKLWAVDIEFTEDSAKDWPALNQIFRIRNLANTTDPESRTFNFFIPLSNQYRVYENDGRSFVAWRFRPGQRVRIQVPVEELPNVIVLPSAAIARDGPEAYIFQQNGDLFNRIPVRVVHEDRTNVVIANDGSISPGFFIAQGSAASLNRVLKAQAASGIRADVHVHADGSTHAAH